MYGPSILPATEASAVIVIFMNPHLVGPVRMVAVSVLLLYVGGSLARFKFNERRLKKAGKKLHD